MLRTAPCPVRRYSFNPNPAPATVAATWALNKCTMDICLTSTSWEAECNSGAPVCYVDRIVCGPEQLTFVDNAGGGPVQILAADNQVCFLFIGGAC